MKCWGAAVALLCGETPPLRIECAFIVAGLKPALSVLITKMNKTDVLWVK